MARVMMYVLVDKEQHPFEDKDDIFNEIEQWLIHEHKIEWLDRDNSKMIRSSNKAFDSKVRKACLIRRNEVRNLRRRWKTLAADDEVSRRTIVAAHSSYLEALAGDSPIYNMPGILEYMGGHYVGPETRAELRNPETRKNYCLVEAYCKI